MSMRSLLEVVEGSDKKDVGLSIKYKKSSGGEMGEVIVRVKKQHAEEFFAELEEWLKANNGKWAIPELDGGKTEQRHLGPTPLWTA